MRTYHQAVRLSPSEAAKVAVAAEVQGQQASSFIRDLLLEAADRVLDQSSVNSTSEQVKGDGSGTAGGPHTP